MKNKKILCSVCFLFAFVSVLWGQNITVKGNVTSKTDGQPIIGASVVQNDSKSTGTITDLDGNFTISVPKNASLAISYIGYKEVIIAAKPSLKIVMEEDSKMIDEVVVTANCTYLNPFPFLYSYISTGNKMNEQSQKWREGSQELDNVISQLESAIEVDRWKRGIRATMEFSNYLGVGAATISGLKYSPNIHVGDFYLRKGFWRTVGGKVHTLEYLSEIAMGKNKGMYKALENSLKIAEKSVKHLKSFGNVVGFASLAYTGYELVTAPTVEGGFDAAAGVASIFFWEVGVVYTGSKIFYNGMQNYYTTMRENGFTPGVDDQIIWK